MSFVLDANVFVSAVLAAKKNLKDPRHGDIARQFMESVRKSRPTIVVPAIFRLEVAMALVRPLGGKGEAFRKRVVEEASGPLLRVAPLDQELIDNAIVLGEELRLKTMDCIYATVAAQFGLPLVSFDAEILERAGGKIRVVSYQSLLAETNGLIAF